MSTQPEPEVAQLPVPTKLEPKNTPRALSTSVRAYFYTIWNGAEAFRKFLASTGNKDSMTGNRLFDRYKAVEMIKAAAVKAEDSLTANAKDGDIYKYVVHIMGKEGLGLKTRREQFKALTHQSPAE
jgi:hypothetical protein